MATGSQQPTTGNRQVVTGIQSIVLYLRWNIFLIIHFLFAPDLSIFEFKESRCEMREFKKYFKLDASPADLYNALTNPAMIEIWTGETAIMGTEPGSEFSIWDGEISGRNIEFVPDRKIVQHWFFGEESDSVVTIKLHPDKNGTNVEVHQTNIPDEAYDNIAGGWESDYIGSLKELFD